MNPQILNKKMYQKRMLGTSESWKDHEKQVENISFFLNIICFMSITKES